MRLGAAGLTKCLRASRMQNRTQPNLQPDNKNRRRTVGRGPTNWINISLGPHWRRPTQLNRPLRSGTTGPAERLRRRSLTTSRTTATDCKNFNEGGRRLTSFGNFEEDNNAVDAGGGPSFPTPPAAANGSGHLGGPLNFGKRGRRNDQRSGRP